MVLMSQAAYRRLHGLGVKRRLQIRLISGSDCEITFDTVVGGIWSASRIDVQKADAKKKRSKIRSKKRNKSMISSRAG